MTDAERLAAQQKLTIDIQTLETEAHRLGCHIGAQSLNRAKNAVGWEIAGDREQAAEASRRDARSPATSCTLPARTCARPGPGRSTSP